MILRAPSLSDSIVDIADWAEFRLLLHPQTPLRKGDLRGMIDFLEDDKGTPSEELDERAEVLVADLIIEFERREQAAPTSYPFKLVDSGTSLKLQKPWNQGHYAYLFGLFASDSCNGRALPDDFFDDDDRKMIPDLLQIVGTIAAAGFVNGGAMSFGWPRPKLKTFGDALKTLVSDYIGEGELRLSPRVGSAKNVKDAGIDIVAWNHSPDRLPGRLILVGQCASGKKWHEKGVRRHLNTFYSDFFDDRFPSGALSAMLVPFCLGLSDSHVQSTSGSDSLNGIYRHYTNAVGVILDRCRLSHYVPAGLHQFNATTNTVERAEDFGEVQDWVNFCITWLRGNVKA